MAKRKELCQLCVTMKCLVQIESAYLSIWCRLFGHKLISYWAMIQPNQWINHINNKNYTEKKITTNTLENIVWLTNKRMSLFDDWLQMKFQI